MSEKERILSGTTVVLSVVCIFLYIKLRNAQNLAKEKFDRESKMFKEGTLQFKPK